MLWLSGTIFHSAIFSRLNSGWLKMDRYFFDLHNGEGAVRDEHGRELASRESIETEIGRILLDVARDELPGQATGIASVIVRDTSGKTVSIGNLSFSKSWLT
jgi:hypothetical protein